MAGTQLDYIVQQFSININGYGHAGDGEMCSLPKIKKKMEEFQGGGMLFPRKRAVGYQALDFSCDLSSFDPTVLGTCGLYGANQNLVFSVAGFMDGDNNAQHTVNCQMAGEVEQLDPGDWAPGKKSKLKFQATLSAIQLVIDNVTIWDLDAQNGVYAVNGTNFYSAVKTALGL